MPASAGPVQDCTALYDCRYRADEARGITRSRDGVLEPSCRQPMGATLFDIVDFDEKGCAGGGSWLGVCGLWICCFSVFLKSC